MSVQEEVTFILDQLRVQVSKPTDVLARTLASLRNEMEIPASSASSSHVRNFSGHQSNVSMNNGSSSSSSGNWRNGISNTPVGQRSNMQKSRSNDTFQTIHKSSSANSMHSVHSNSSGSIHTPTTPQSAGRYQSRFTSSGNLDDKILNVVIGNKLNAFTPLTYNDTRDFIYQIMDSGENAFVRDFVEKVFQKATIEELYCGLFAKLIAEIAHRYPIMYDEMNRFHQEFVKVFEDVQEGSSSSAEAEENLKKRQYRLGYGHFLSELASQNALQKEHLIAMVDKVRIKLDEVTAEPDKIKTTEEFVDCLVRLTTSLSECSNNFFNIVKGDLRNCLLKTISPLIDRKAGDRPSLSVKARFALMDLRDLLA